MKTTVNHSGKSGFLSSDRMISLSDTIFGVAMTLQASTLLPSILTLKGSVFSIIHDMQGQFIAVALGFAISGSYWVVQQHRLAMTATVTPLQTFVGALRPIDLDQGRITIIHSTYSKAGLLFGVPR